MQVDLSKEIDAKLICFKFMSGKKLGCLLRLILICTDEIWTTAAGRINYKCFATQICVLFLIKTKFPRVAPLYTTRFVTLRSHISFLFLPSLIIHLFISRAIDNRVMYSVRSKNTNPRKFHENTEPRWSTWNSNLPLIWIYG